MFERRNKDDLRDGKQALMVSITDRFLTTATHNNRSRNMLNSTSPLPITIRLMLAQPPGLSQHWPTFKTGAYNKATNTKQCR